MRNLLDPLTRERHSDQQESLRRIRGKGPIPIAAAPAQAMPCPVEGDARKQHQIATHERASGPIRGRLQHTVAPGREVLPLRTGHHLQNALLRHSWKERIPPGPLDEPEEGLAR